MFPFFKHQRIAKIIIRLRDTDLSESKANEFVELLFEIGLSFSNQRTRYYFFQDLIRNFPRFKGSPEICLRNKILRLDGLNALLALDALLSELATAINHTWNARAGTRRPEIPLLDEKCETYLSLIGSQGHWAIPRMIELVTKGNVNSTVLGLSFRAMGKPAKEALLAKWAALKLTTTNRQDCVNDAERHFQWQSDEERKKYARLIKFLQPDWRGEADLRSELLLG